MLQPCKCAIQQFRLSFGLVSWSGIDLRRPVRPRDNTHTTSKGVRIPLFYPDWVTWSDPISSKRGQGVTPVSTRG